jgi:non-canonical (house-cleaning) NTP pyrophosphatase
MAIGIEDGLVRMSEESPSDDFRDYFNVGCAWVTDGEREGHGFSSGFAYPPGSLAPAIRDQAPIGDLFDALWREERPAVPDSKNRPESRASDGPKGTPATPAPSGRGGGNIGLLTGGSLERADYGSHAVVCALVPFLHSDLYA